MYPLHYSTLHLLQVYLVHHPHIQVYPTLSQVGAGIAVTPTEQRTGILQACALQCTALHCTVLYFWPKNSFSEAVR